MVLFIEPIDSWHIAAAEDAVGVGIFVVEASLLSWMFHMVEEARRRSAASAALAESKQALLTENERMLRDAQAKLEDLLAARTEALRGTEEQLRQAQKMEAVGRLAGGVAHDFNNILSVILSYGEAALEELTANEPLRDDIGEMVKAGRRAAELTKQLLLFSRQQVVEQAVHDLDTIVVDFRRMMSRCVGEDVELVVVAGAEHGNVKVDRGAIEQLLMNLVVNARDAMPHGGTLTIETSDVVLDEAFARDHVGVSPGRHVRLAVTDTGTGMSPTTAARIFEPFFTTKDKGKGTGLGLSMVFGIVKQSGGTIWVTTKEGTGTRFDVYLPVADAPAATEAPSATVAVAEEVRRGTVLVVDDDDQVRGAARDVLRRRGHEVLEARNAGEALVICERHASTIHLLLSDVVMPYVGGPELATRLLELRPEMRVLCMSGYSDETVAKHGMLGARFAYLQKPFTPRSLAAKVIDVLSLDRTTSPGGRVAV